MARPAHPKRDPEVAVLVVDAVPNLVQRRTTTLEGHGFQDYTAADGPPLWIAPVRRRPTCHPFCGRTGGFAVAISEAPR